jgi:predicted DCC family thiol-disulfide oxidoreductase YuxK
MKTLSNKLIIYDDVCPLCKAYTNGFVNIGWLLPQHRIGFSQASKELLDSIDLDRARHEIPLYDTETKQTLYGKEALFFILGEEIPWLKPVFRLRPFRFFITVLYQIITYNRRIIAGSKAPVSGFDCAPDFNLSYRWLYIGLAGVGSFAIALAHFPIPPSKVVYGFYGLLFFCVAKGLIIKDLRSKTNYFGHLATVLLALHIVAAFFDFSDLSLTVLAPMAAYWLAWRLR